MHASVWGQKLLIEREIAVSRSLPRVPLLLAGALTLAVFFSPPLAADQAEDAFLAALAPSPGSTAVPGSVPEPVGVAVTSSCTAHCWDGSTVTCSGTTCSAQDSNCVGGGQGQCTGTSSGTILCPSCPTCTTTCQSGGSVSCRYGSTCTTRKNCWAMCDGVLFTCNPLPASCPL